MFRIYAAKQVGDVSYLVKDWSVFYDILENQHIKRSKAMELNPRTRKKSYYVSLSRNFTAAALRNNTRWRYGVVIDGDKLSNRYHIEPFSFTGANLNNGGKIGIKDLTAYDDGTYKLRLVNWPAMPISRETFDFIESLILSQSDEFNKSHKLVIQDGGKRRVAGRMIEKKYNYNVKHGDGCRLLVNVDKLPGEITTFLTKDPRTNEYEERIWTSDEYIDISKCIKGIIIPRSEIPDFESSDFADIVQVRDILDSMYREYTITYY